MRNMKTGKCISSLTNQLGYRFRLFKNRAPTHSMLSASTNITKH